MTQTPDPRHLERLEAQLATLRDGALKLEARYLPELERSTLDTRPAPGTCSII